MNFKKMTFLCMQRLTNFPYIEEDFDALTNYELLCKVVEYLNKVIANENNQNDAINELAEAFNTLKNYVDNYFDNLDVQDEIDNKIEDMIESGEFQEIIAEYMTTKLSIYDSISAMENNTVVGEMFKLKGYDTTFITTENQTISSLKINDNLYADIVSKTASVNSLGITTNIDNDLFAEIVEYVRNKGVEIYFLHKTYNLTSSINIPSGNKLKLSGLGYDSVINYTGSDYAFIFNKLQQAELKDFTINCTSQGGGIYIKYVTGQANTNNLTSTLFKKVYIYNSKNPFKNDCHCGYVNFEECIFEVGTTDGIGIDFRDSYYPEFITIEKCAIRTIYRSTNNTGKGICFNSGTMINIRNNDIIGFNIGFELDSSSSSEVVSTINLLENSIWDCLSKGIYVQSVYSNRVNGLSIKDCMFKNSQRNDTLEYAIHLVSCQGLAVDSISMQLPTTRQIFLSDCHVGYVKNINARQSSIVQTNNQIGDDINYEYINTYKSYTVPANNYVDVECGSPYNIVNFKNYLITRRGGNNTTNVLSSSNQTIANGLIKVRLTNSSSSDVSINFKGI